jgi:hypothetical protein
MVRPNDEMTPKKILFKHLQVMDDREEFLSCHTVVLFPLVKGSAGVCYDALDSVLNLRQNGPNAMVGCVGVQYKVASIHGHGQNWGRGERFLQLIEGMLRLPRPNKVLSLLL